MDTHFRLKLRRLIEFFDEKPPESWGHSNALVALLGEESAMQIIKNYFERNGDDVISIGQKCNQGRTGKRLDGWVLVHPSGSKNKIVCYQTEIKHISSHSYNWKPLQVGKSKDDIKKLADERKKRFEKFLGNPKDERIWKVLTEMKHPKLPKGYEGFEIEIQPLLCLWDAMHHEGKGDAFFQYPFTRKFANSFLEPEKKKFKKYCWIFSMSNYVRKLIDEGEQTIEIELSETAMRLEWIRQIIGHAYQP